MCEPESVPVWLNEAFFIQIFQDELNIPSKEFRVAIKSFEPIEGHPTLLRTKVDLIKVNDDGPIEYAFIVKYLNDTNDDSAYTREIAMYEEILPALEYEWKVRNEKITIAPKLYRTSAEPVKLLVIRDELNTKSLHDLDVNHTKVVLDKLAKYHASTAVYYDKYTTYGETFDVDYTKHRQEFDTRWMNVYSKSVELLKHHKPLESFAAKMENWRDRAGDELYDSVLKVNKSSLNVLNHGACQTNNLLFSYNERNEVVDVVLIDFQESIFNTPVYDLLYFFVTSISTDIFKSDRIDELIAFYHTNLVLYLKKLNYRMYVPSLKEFNVEILQKSFWGCYVSVLNFSSLMESGDVDESDIHRLASVYKWFDRRGMMDI